MPHASSKHTANRRPRRSTFEPEPSETEKARLAIRKADIEDLDKGCRWAFKYHALFPLLEPLRHADHYFRLIYPLAYGTVVAILNATFF